MSLAKEELDILNDIFKNPENEWKKEELTYIYGKNECICSRCKRKLCQDTDYSQIQQTMRRKFIQRRI